MSGPRRFEKLLVANRGEIAARVIKAASDAGLSTVAVYSEADRGASYLAGADEAVAIGPAPPAASYLAGPRLIAAALESGAQAVHPGYGFLSENAGFARDCERAGLVFVGPPARVIEDMSRKDRARAIAEGAGLAALPAVSDGDDRRLLAAAREKVGFPALVKAVAGGGGKAMHVVADADGLAEALPAARREAEGAFGDGSLLVERFVGHGRHIEAQIAADEAGNVVHLFERDCSVQRRHQKVIEEAPAPTVPESLRRRLLEAGVALARSVGYVNLGTVEFLVDGDDVWFLEMNTRLQVEHRVTEAVTGLDLVGLQLGIAQGLSLPFTQEEIGIEGHAIELRLYAEDPEAGFLPQTGRPSYVRLSPDALVDATVEAGRAVTGFYDPMLAKIVVSGPDRASATSRLLAAIDDSAVFGLRTNLGFCRHLLASEAFARAAIDVNTLDARVLAAPGRDEQESAAVMGAVLAHAVTDTPLGAGDGWRLGAPPAQPTLRLFGPEEAFAVVLDRPAGTATLRGRTRRVEVLSRTRNRAFCLLDGVETTVHLRLDGGGITVGLRGGTYRFDFSPGRRRHEGPGSEDGALRAPMPGVVLQLGATPGTTVRAGEVLAVLESMKMELPLRSPHDGVVSEVMVAAGDHVGLGEGLLRIEAGKEAGR